MPDLSFLADEGPLTTKDKLVLLTAVVVDSDNPSTLATQLNMSVASVRQSLAKQGKVGGADDVKAVKEIQAAIIEVCQMHQPSMRSQDHRLVAKVAADLLETGATADEVRRRARNLALRFHLWATPGSLDKYWSQLADSSNPFAPKVVLR